MSGGFCPDTIWGKSILKKFSSRAAARKVFRPFFQETLFLGGGGDETFVGKASPVPPVHRILIRKSTEVLFVRQPSLHESHICGKL